MKKIVLCTLLFLAFPATHAADFDGSKPLLCSAVVVNECVPGGSCEQVKKSDVGAPDFLRVDARKKTMTGTANGADRPTNKIESSGVLGNMLILQGKASGLEHLPEDSLAWSMSIDQATGGMVLSMSGNAVAFVVFGSCINP